MLPCPACKRHIRSGDTTCPFCAAALRSTTGPQAPVLATMALALLGFACKSAEDGTDEANQTTSTETAGTTETSTETAGTTETSTETAGTTETTETSTETSTESAGTESTTDTTTEEGGSFYAGPTLDVMPDSDPPEVLYDGPQPHLPKHGVRYRLPE